MNKTLLIADSGSTKTDWLFIGSDGTKTELHTKGINPARDSRDTIYNAIYHELLTSLPDSANLQAIFFYGAGCIEPFDKSVRSVLEELFPESNIEVESDLLGAARALCGHEEGIACILGTGSNSCLYNGKDITLHTPPLGYILGDEGSAARLGKLFISDFLKGLVPAHIANALTERCDTSYEAIVENIYRSSGSPSAYLGDLAPFIMEHYEDPYIRNLVDGNFRAF